MNNDLISRSALKAAFKAWKTTDDYYHSTDCDDIPFSEAFDLIDNAPTVDTTCPHCDSGYAQGYSDGYLRGKEERPQGEWITHITYFECSNCKHCYDYDYAEDIDPITDLNFNFCPNCGADMRGGGENE